MKIMLGKYHQKTHRKCGVQADANMADPPRFAAVSIQPGRHLLGMVNCFDLGDPSRRKVKDDFTCLEYLGQIEAAVGQCFVYGRVN